MSIDVFDENQLSAMKRAIDQILSATDEGANLSRQEVAHAVFAVACEHGEFDAPRLAAIACKRLSHREA